MDENSGTGTVRTMYCSGVGDTITVRELFVALY